MVFLSLVGFFPVMEYIALIAENRGVTSVAKDHRVGRKSIQRKRLIVYEQVMSRAPCMHQTLTVHSITE